MEDWQRPATNDDLSPILKLEHFGVYIPTDAVNRLNSVGIHLTHWHVHALWMSLKSFETDKYLEDNFKWIAIEERAVSLIKEVQKIVLELPNDNGWRHILELRRDDNDHSDSVSEQIDYDQMSEEELLEGISRLPPVGYKYEEEYEYDFTDPKSGEYWEFYDKIKSVRLDVLSKDLATLLESLEQSIIPQSVILNPSSIQEVIEQIVNGISSG